MVPNHIYNIDIYFQKMKIICFEIFSSYIYNINMGIFLSHIYNPNINVFLKIIGIICLKHDLLFKL